MSGGKAPDKALESLSHWNELGRALAQRRRYREALECYDRALTIRSSTPQIWANRANALRNLGRLIEAEASLREALRLKPDFANAYNNLGLTLLMLGRVEEAEVSFYKAIELDLENADFRKNLAYLCMRLGRAVDAQASYRAALCLRPDDAEIHEDLGMALLLSGRFEEGWAEYEWRWKTRKMAAEARRFPMPQWRGEPLGDKVILLHAEQGHGDTIQFCRYVERIPAKEIILEVQPALLRLLSQSHGVAKTIARCDALPAHDVHCSLLSLPHALGTTLDSIPNNVPYLRANAQAVAHWQKRLADLPGLRVGLCWAGGRSPINREQNDVDNRRSLPLETLEPLGGMERVSFISLQKDSFADQSDNLSGRIKLHDFTDDLQDFADTAALIEALDLVISVDTAVAHLAGALNKPVWLLNRFDTCFRWLENRDDSPWYPSLRQFRQLAPGDWNNVIGRVRGALQRAIKGEPVAFVQASSRTEHAEDNY